MTTSADRLLHRLAESVGLQVQWRNAHGEDQTVTPDTLRNVLQALEIPCSSEAQCRDSLAALEQNGAGGEHDFYLVRAGSPLIIRRKGGSLHYRLLLEDGTRIMGTAQDMGGSRALIPGIRRPGHHVLDMAGMHCRVAVVPHRCPSVEGLLQRYSKGDRGWVLGAQLYSLRRESEAAGGNFSSSGSNRPRTPSGWEVGGDFSLLRSLAAQAAQEGAAGLAISPVHAMFSADPSRYSPYSPSSRLFLNAMYAYPPSVFDATLLGELSYEPAAASQVKNACMDWPAIQQQRLVQLRRLFQAFEKAAPPEAMRDFQLFREQGGEALTHHACYEALHENFVERLGPGHGWQDWPAEFRDPASEAIRRYAQDHEPALRFHAFLQWLAARSLADAQGAASANMPFGLIADLAVGTDPRGSHAWSRQAQIMTDVSVGAPPDIFQPQGQDWGLTAFSPRALEQHGFDGYIETLRAVLTYAGGVRVDHVMGLARMWLIPSGASPTDGVYLRYPREHMMDLLMLEAWRHEAVVVGENLGTVPEDFNDALTSRGMLGMSVLWFEQEGNSDEPKFHPAQGWPEASMSMITTHDLPTLKGWWVGRDIEWRQRQGDIGEDRAKHQAAQRDAEKQALWRAVNNEGQQAESVSVPAEAPITEVLSYVASTPSVLFSVAIEDLLGMAEQPNMPGGAPDTPGAEAHPNWCRVHDLPVGGILSGDKVKRRLTAIRRARQGEAPMGMEMPRSTVRLQLHAGYTLEDAAKDLPYFAELGVSHLYLSPVTRASSGSTHGYDVVDHTVVDEERGGEAALRKLAAACHQAGMGILLDIVPNHMATDPDNAWWWDVLKHGRASRWAEWFDIDWESPILRGRILAPFLDKPYPDALRNGDIQLSSSEERGLHITAHGVPFPLAPGSVEDGINAEQLISNHDPSTPEGRSRLQDLLDRQHYCLAWWHRAADLINWRRFFEVSGLIGVRVERDDVFEAVHELVLRLYAEGVVDGLRVDHVDGLAQPLDYCRRLYAAMESVRANRPLSRRDMPVWILVEKILAPGEVLDERWMVSGTTGYDFAADVGGLMHDGRGENRLFQAWSDISGDHRAPPALLAQARKELLDRNFIAERDTLLRKLMQVAANDPEAADWPQQSIGRALDTLLSHYPTYRSYVEPDVTRSEADQQWFNDALRGAQLSLEGEPEPYSEILSWLDRRLGGEAPSDKQSLQLVQRFQQLTPPLAAKALEDTVFYRYGALLSRNEVGSDPNVFSLTAEGFHERNLRRAARSPLGLLATATHDHKRGEDLRARLAVLSEIPQEWLDTSREWMEMDAQRARSIVPVLQYMVLQMLVGAWPPALRPDDEAGVNDYLGRMAEWLVKAMREGKQYSNWFEPDSQYEHICTEYLMGLAPGKSGHEVLKAIERFVRRLEPAAVTNGLIQAAMRITSPGVPDLYQGTEYRDFTLVDPDNRSEVDYERRAATLASTRPPLGMQEWSADAWYDGRVKQALVASLLRLRRDRPDCFQGDYRPLIAMAAEAPSSTGAASQPDILAFVRGNDVVVIAGVKCAASVQPGRDGMPMLPASHWGEATLSLPGGGHGWRDVLRGRKLPSGNDQRLVADLLTGFPLAVLCRD